MLTEALVVFTVFGTGHVEPWWRWCCENSSEYAMFVGGCFASQFLFYFLGCLPYMLLDVSRGRSGRPYKIQRAKYASRHDIVKSTIDMCLSFIAVVLPLLIVGGFVIGKCGISREGPLPSWHVILAQVFFFFLVEDYMNYWIHRWLHLPWLYKHVHSVHHKYDAPFAIVAAYAHPVEVLAQAIPTFAGPLMIGPHLYTLMVWQTFRNWEAIDIHSGYEFPLSLKSLFPSYAGAEHHDYHHYMHSGNFASIFTWCDKLYGTNLGYESFLAKGRERSMSPARDLS